ncbi:MAG: class I SAM-dependent methyltransferase [Planctomycetes bacterium]|nr:class I SAM-dependent methyltransferase [Planctomycetota bacterium]
MAFLDGRSIVGKTFLDIGCGSGLFSLAAHRLGAARVLSIDVDPDSVRSSLCLREREGNPPGWEVRPGSILDPELVRSLGRFEIVYSWGVLHHTGRMWEGVENAASLVSAGGLLYIAIYNRADGFAFYDDGRFGPSSLWAVEKRLYSRLPSLLQDAVDWTAMSLMVLLYLATLQNPLKKIRSHAKLRGMSWRIDIKDWLGGWPYEYASVEEVFRFLSRKGFVLRNLKSTNGLRNNEYLFERTP